MDAIPYSAIPVLTGSDLQSGKTILTLENSVLARLTSPIMEVVNHENSIALRKLLQLVRKLKHGEDLGFAVAWSQAVHYDQIKEKGGLDSQLRLLVPSMAIQRFDTLKGVLFEWPVAAVSSIIKLFSNPNHLEILQQDGMRFEQRFIELFRAPDEDSREIGLNEARLILPLCTYQAGNVEDEVAKAFCFSNFDRVSRNRVVDVCHAASHLRFARRDDFFVVNDRHFKKDRLQAIGLNCIGLDDLEGIPQFNQLSPIQIDEEDLK